MKTPHAPFAPAVRGRPRAVSGMSLVEMLVASAMLLIVIGAALHIMITGQTAFNHQNLVSTLQDRGRRYLEEIAREISAADGASLSILNEHTELRFQVPVDYDKDGDVLQADGKTIEFGARFNNTPYPGYLVRYRFVWGGKMPCEYCDRLDYNNNGRIDAYFRQGKIVREVITPTGAVLMNSTQDFAQDVIVKYYPQDGDVNGDYKNDPLFTRISGFDAMGNPVENTMNGNQLLVNAWIMKLDEKRFPVILNFRTSFRLRNVK